MTSPHAPRALRTRPGSETVTRPTIISVSRVVDPAVKLHTELDQYLFRYQFSSSSGPSREMRSTSKPRRRDCACARIT